MNVGTEEDARNKIGLRGKNRSPGHFRALIFEDEPVMCSLIKEALVAADIESVTVVKSADVGIGFQVEKFDMILVDAGMPSTEAEKLVRLIRSTGYNQKTPIIMISEDQNPLAASKGFEAGANFFAYKPIDKVHLMRLIQVTEGAVEQAKRRFRRVAVQVKIQVACGNIKTEGQTIDLSLNGTLIQASRTFPTGSIVEVSLFFSAEKMPVTGLGTIMRVSADNQMGIQFEQLPIEESGRLQDYLLPLIVR